MGFKNGQLVISDASSSTKCYLFVCLEILSTHLCMESIMVQPVHQFVYYNLSK